MAFKGKAKEKSKEFTKDLFVGFSKVRVVALNPTRAELSKLFGKSEDEEEKEEFKYLDEDKDGNRRLRLAFWLYDEDNDKYFVQNLSLVDEERKNKEGNKVQIINSTCGTSWVPYKEDAKGNITDEVEEGLIQDWFIQFTDKTKQFLGKKKWKKAIRGEEELGIFLRAWLNMQWNDPDTEVLVDTKKLFQENLKDFKSMIGNEEFTNEFVILTGVRTSDEDSTKKYQEIFKKGYLPQGFMMYIKAGNKMSNEYTKGVWKKFTDSLKGDYGFSCFHKLKPLEKYNEKEDPVGSNAGKPEVPISQEDNEY